MSIRIIDGNIFTTECQTIVNTINCVGVMGAGIALEMRLRYPDLNSQYVSLCDRRQIAIGSLWIFKVEERWILNFPTKHHWKDVTKEEYLHRGLQKFMTTHVERGVKSIAFPLLGAQNGGLDKITSENIMRSYLSNCKIPVEIYRYDPMAPDDLYDKFREMLLNMSKPEIKCATGLKMNYIEKVLMALGDQRICQLNRLASVDGIGIKTIEKLFDFARSKIMGKPATGQQSFGF